MERNIQEFVPCEHDREYKIYCKICDRLCIELFYKNHPESGTHNSTIPERQQLNDTSTNN